MTRSEQAFIRRVARLYRLKIVEFLSVQKGYRNTSYPALLSSEQTVNFITYKSEPHILERIQRTNATSEWCAVRGLPVRHPVDQRIVKLQGQKRTAYGALYTYLAGNTIPWQSFTKTHIKLAGLSLSTIHHALQDMPRHDNSVTDEYTVILKNMQRYFANEEVLTALDEKLDIRMNVPFVRLAGILQIASAFRGQQNLHMDFVRGNLLFAPARPDDVFVLNGIALTGILDFEKTTYGHPVFDIARTLAFLCVDCGGKSSEKIQKYFLESGYNKRGPAHFSYPMISYKAQRVDILNELTTLFLLHDFYKFLRHNPYESLMQNGHFVRTKNILLEKGMIQLSK